jgi:hypothetical protein
MVFSTRGRLFHFLTGRLKGHETVSGSLLLNIFEACKRGDFSSTAALPKVFDAESTLDVTVGALELLPYVTPFEILLDIAEPIFLRLRSDRQNVEWLCIALSRSGSLAATQSATSIYVDELGTEARTDVPYHLSITLEPSAGDVFYGPQIASDTIDELEPENVQYDVNSYAATVQARISDLRAIFPDWSQQCFLYGRPIDIEELALGLLNTIARTSDNERVVVGRSVLEAFTGADLSAFFKGGQLDRASAASALEALFDEFDLSGFQPGVRYFFGRRIPD